MVDEEIVARRREEPARDRGDARPRRGTSSCLAAERKHAYFDMALPIGEAQTISPPFIVAYMTEQLDPQPTDKVLEIGTGSGYQAAVLSPLVQEVYTIEIVEPLGRRAAATLKRLKYDNVHTKVGDGYQGWPEHAPFDKIIVTCSPENVPPPLVEQLKEGGRMVIPVGERYQQTLYLLQKGERQAGLRGAAADALRAHDRRGRGPPHEVSPIRCARRPPTASFEERGRSRPMAGRLALPAAGKTASPIRNRPTASSTSTFTNSEPGRGCQALQGFAVDGRKVSELDVSLRVRLKDVKPGQTIDQLPMLGITLYDERRAIIGQRGLGPWRGTFDWREERAETQNPPANARGHSAHRPIGRDGRSGV